MSHGIQSTVVNGVARIEAMYTHKPAWHNLGTVWTKEAPPTSREMILGANLDWTVEKRPVQFAGSAGNSCSMKGKYVTVRTDNDTGLGVVGERYTVVQNWDCFAFLDSLVSEGQVTYESAFAMYGGEQVAVLARMPGYDTIAEGDDVMRHILMLNSHDGSGMIHFIPTSVRVVCANTVRLAMQKDAAFTYTIRHTSSVEDQLQMARMYLSQFNEAFDLFSEQGRQMANKKMTNDEREAFIRTLFPQPTSDGKLIEKGRAYTNWLTTIETVNTLAVAGRRNIMKPIKGTLWGVFNAVTEFLDHRTKYRGESAESNRVKSTLYGENAAMKQEALNLAMTFLSA